MEIYSSGLWSLSLVALVSTKTYVQKHFVLKIQVSSSLSLFAWCCSLGMSALEVKATAPSSWMSVVANPLSDTSTWIVLSFVVLKHLSIVSSHTNDLNMSNTT